MSNQNKTQHPADEFSLGDRIRVTHRHERPSNNPEKGWEEIVETDTGTIVAVPSRRFDWPQDDFDFDYRLETPSGSGAVRSVSLSSKTVCQLHYDAGGDRDWDSFDLISVEEASND